MSNAKKTIGAVLILAGVIIAGGFYFENTKEKTISRVCLKDNCYRVELAQTPLERARGLMFRRFLADGAGMLFVFEVPGVNRFWMKNTLIPLDIVWIGEDKKIIHISEDTPPCAQDPCPSYGPEALAGYVLEINAGQIKKIGARIGDAANIE
jgi:uncharacterized protein